MDIKMTSLKTKNTCFNPKLFTVVPHIVSAGNYSLWNLEIAANSNSCPNISIFYIINCIFAAETIKG